MSEEKLKKPKELTRREFLKDAGIVVGGTAVGSSILLSACGEKVDTTKTVTITTSVAKYVCPLCQVEFNSIATLTNHFETEHQSEAPEVQNIITLNVNGRTYKIMAEPNWTLADVLRQQLRLTGTKISCSGSECGMCTVLVNGKPMLSCTILAMSADGMSIETIEGLSNNGELNPIQKAFIEKDGLQCGFCTPAFILSTKAMLVGNPNPTEDEIRQGLSGVLCRCAAYEKIIDSVEYAAELIGGK